ncbi:MAG TPA: CBS domain-containing protein [Terriglobales bacterium]|nr:CBS domain-containing protein [Terriglobales bacterium]
MPTSLALSELLGATVYDVNGVMSGRVREIALAPQDDAARVAAIIVRTPQGDRVLGPKLIHEMNGSIIRVTTASEDWLPLGSSEGYLLLERDLLDQQIIDVHGRKVVRVNDVEFFIERTNGHPALKIHEVEVGPRGAVRRLLKGLVPRLAVSALALRLTARAIPWDFVDLIETDPSRRVKLKIDHERLSKLHPADLADILEELAPAQREAIFESLDEEVAAEALEEIDPKLQASLVESLDSDHAADIVEEMDPDAAADLLENLPAGTSEEILDEMEAEEREEVEELLEHHEDTAAGRMTTEFLAVAPNATVEQAIDVLRSYEGGIETINTIYLIDADEKCVGAVSLAMLAMAPGGTIMESLATVPLVSCSPEAKEDDFVELFDKYNLINLPVIDAEGRINGVITADDIISLLRKKM